MMFDYQLAFDQMGQDDDLLQEIIGLFLTDCDSMTMDIEKAIAREDASAIGLAAHSLKGVLLSLAATAPAETAWELECAAAEQGRNRVEMLFVLLQEQIDSLKIDLLSAKKSTEA
jgi:HPt (histidine-containing phosphotransfer) domain-containing protein